MKKYLLKIKNKIKSLISFKKINPHHHWIVLLYIFFGMVVFLVIFSFYLLYRIKNEQIFQVVPSNIEAPTLINEKLLKKVNESFDNKLLREKEIKEGVEVYKDPSIN